MLLSNGKQKKKKWGGESTSLLVIMHLASMFASFLCSENMHVQEMFNNQPDVLCFSVVIGSNVNKHHRPAWRLFYSVLFVCLFVCLCHLILLPFNSVEDGI